MKRVLTAVCYVSFAVACSNGASQPPPTAPSPAASIPAIPTLSGTVYESTPDGRHPLAGVGLDVSVEYQSWPPIATTDADGHYTVHVSSGKVIATKAGYSQPCRVPVSQAVNGVLDIYLVADDVLSTTGVPASMPQTGPVLSGLVYEQTATGRRGVPGARLTMDFSGGLGWAPSATTRSDAAGRYLLCGIDATQGGIGLWLLTSAAGYIETDLTVDRRATSLDVELARR